MSNFQAQPNQNQDSTAFNNPVISLDAPIDPTFHEFLPNPMMMPMVPMTSDGSFTAMSPGLIPADSGLQKLGSATSMNSMNSFATMNSMSPMNFTAWPQAQATSPNNLGAPQPMYYQATPHFMFTTPSVSPQPAFVPSMSPQPIYHSVSPQPSFPAFVTPSPLLTPQTSLRSVGSAQSDGSVTIDGVPVVNMQAMQAGNVFSLNVPQQRYTSSRSVEHERQIPTGISPQRPERATTQIAFRERPYSQQNDQIHRAGYPPHKNSNYSAMSNQGQAGFAGKKQKKFGYRSKQRKIEKTHRAIKEKFTNLGLFAAERELVRGDDTLRVHVKTFEGFTDIVNALNEIDDHPDINICRVAAVFSKKNRFQKKGFIVYMKLGSVEELERSKGVLHGYNRSLRNIAIARAKSSTKEPSSEAPKHPVQRATYNAFVPELPTVPRRLSATAM